MKYTGTLAIVGGILLGIVGIILGILILAGLAWCIGYFFENWLTWCEVDPVMLRTLIVAMGFVIPFMVVRPSHSD